MAGSGVSAGPQRGQQRRGSAFTDKQIARSAKDGRAVQVTLPDDSKVVGWVFGMDDFHWGLVTLDGRTLLVHKSAPCLEFTEHLLGDQQESVRARIEPVVKSFRTYVVENVFDQNSPANS